MTKCRRLRNSFRILHCFCYLEVFGSVWKLTVRFFAPFCQQYSV
jgi:hypothetical protein